jgi:hypothetical protein
MKPCYSDSYWKQSIFLKVHKMRSDLHNLIFAKLTVITLQKVVFYYSC